MIIIPDGSHKKVRMGTKVATEKIRRSEHESAGQMADAHERNKEKIAVDCNDKAQNGIMCVCEVS